MFLYTIVKGFNCPANILRLGVENFLPWVYVKSWKELDHFTFHVLNPLPLPHRLCSSRTFRVESLLWGKTIWWSITEGSPWNKMIARHPILSFSSFILKESWKSKVLPPPTVRRLWFLICSRRSFSKRKIPCFVFQIFLVPLHKILAR